jgi:hypothetical protein
MTAIEFCPSCGTARWADAQFCGACGADIGAWEREFVDAAAAPVEDGTDGGAAGEADDLRAAGAPAEAVGWSPPFQAAEAERPPLPTPVPAASRLDVAPPWPPDDDTVPPRRPATEDDLPRGAWPDGWRVEDESPTTAVVRSRPPRRVPPMGLALVGGGVVVAAAVGIGTFALLGGLGPAGSPAPSAAAVAMTPSPIQASASPARPPHGGGQPGRGRERS